MTNDIYIIIGIVSMIAGVLTIIGVTSTRVRYIKELFEEVDSLHNEALNTTRKEDLLLLSAKLTTFNNKKKSNRFIRESLSVLQIINAKLFTLSANFKHE